MGCTTIDITMATEESNPTVLPLQERFAELQKATQKPRYPFPKIQRVANHLRIRKHFAKHYSPMFVSIGPIHHGDTNLQLGESYKLMWAAQYLETTGHDPQILHKRITDHIEELKGLFTTDVLTNNKWSSYYSRQGFVDLEEKLSWMLFVDGCSLLQILEKANLEKPEQLNVKVDQLVLVMRDVLLLENQLPFILLLLLRDVTNDELLSSSSDIYDETRTAFNHEEERLINAMKKFLRYHHWTRNNYDKWVLDYYFYIPPTPTHLLDFQRNIITLSSRVLPQCERPSAGFYVEGMRLIRENDDPQKIGENENNSRQSREDNADVMVKKYTHRNIQELKAAGIRLKSSKTRRPRDISFSHGWLAGKLTLPEIIVDDTTAATFLNLMAYEMCPDFENDYEICSFAAFMDSLIDQPEDVKALRSKGILLNSLGSDKEVADLFNIISSDLVSDMQMYSDVRDKIEKHYTNKLKTWIALGCHTYFRNPWVIIALLTTLFVLILTSIQTWFAIHPRAP